MKTLLTCRKSIPQLPCHCIQFCLLVAFLLFPAQSMAAYSAPPPPGGATFSGLGGLSYTGARQLQFVSRDGKVVVGSEDFIREDGYGGLRAFVRTSDSGLVPLLLPRGIYSQP